MTDTPPPRSASRHTAAGIVVLDRGESIRFSFEDALKYSGPGSPGGVALAFRVMQRAWRLLATDEALERGEVTVRTAFAGPGARDAFELVTRAVTDGRYAVDPALARPERGPVLERFAFRIGYRDRTVTILLREGFVTEEFVELARKDPRTVEETARLEVLKRALADLVMATPAAEVFEVE